NYGLLPDKGQWRLLMAIYGRFVLGLLNSRGCNVRILSPRSSRCSISAGRHGGNLITGSVLYSDRSRPLIHTCSAGTSPPPAAAIVVDQLGDDSYQRRLLSFAYVFIWPFQRARRTFDL